MRQDYQRMADHTLYHTVYIRVNDAVYGELSRIAKAEDRRICYVAGKIIKSALHRAPVDVLVDKEQK